MFHCQTSQGKQCWHIICDFRYFQKTIDLYNMKKILHQKIWVIKNAWMGGHNAKNA